MAIFLRRSGLLGSSPLLDECIKMSDPPATNQRYYVILESGDGLRLQVEAKVAFRCAAVKRKIYLDGTKALFCFLFGRGRRGGREAEYAIELN